MNLSRQLADDIFAKVLKYSQADETEAAITGTNYSLTRFANNSIHQNVAEEDLNISVRAVAGQRTARTSTNKNDDDSIRQMCSRALDLARLEPPDADLLPMPGPQTYMAVARLDEETAGLTAAERAENVHRAILRAEKDGLTAAGIFSSGSNAMALYNSRGVAAFHEESVSEFSVTMLGDSSSGWAKQTGQRWRELGIDDLADRAARKAMTSHEPREAQPGKYTVILEPSAVMDLLGFFLLDFGGLAVEEKRSCFTGRVGQRVFGGNIQIRDDVYHTSQGGAPFDGEGMPRARVNLVENGVVSNLVYCRQSAKKMGTQPTGHGFPLPNEYGEAPLNLVFEGGGCTREEMIGSTERGLLVTRFWYIREVDPYTKILTGMTRDGTFMIEDGEIKYGVRNFRFNQSLIDMLNQVEMMTAPQRAAGEESVEMVVPALKIKDFNFSSLTKF
ncbi:MAG: TldD/PmbA family protein [Acidobacteriota bacterium]|nr:TldD/PmbA family protein [Acidobacteriota bacterium]